MRVWAKDFRWSWLAPLMVYFAAGVSGFASIAETFVVKEKFGFDAAFLASLAFWAGLPWTLKIPVGHAVDMFWDKRGWIVGAAGAALACSTAAMALLAGDPSLAPEWLGLKGAFALCAISAPFCFMAQDAVADAMTVEAVESSLKPGSGEMERARAHSGMQALGRLMLVGGGFLVALANAFIFDGADALPREAAEALYAKVYWAALAIPALSVSGVALGAWFGRGKAAEAGVRAKADWRLLGGSAALAAGALGAGAAGFPGAKELVFCASLGVLLFLAGWLGRSLSKLEKTKLACAGAAIFAFRAMPSAGPGLSWWMIDELGFDAAFLAKLSLVGGACALSGIFVYKAFFSKMSIYRVVAALTLVGSALSLPTLGLWHGLHRWLEAESGGALGARFVAVVDGALSGPLTELAMIPMLAWIAGSAPKGVRAAWFATLASLSNLALSFSRLSTSWLTEVFVVEARRRGPSGEWIAGNYDQLGSLLWISFGIGLVVPLAVCWAGWKISQAAEAKASVRSATESAESEFDGPLALAEPDPEKA